MDASHAVGLIVSGMHLLLKKIRHSLCCVSVSVCVDWEERKKKKIPDDSVKY